MEVRDLRAVQRDAAILLSLREWNGGHDRDCHKKKVKIYNDQKLFCIFCFCRCHKTSVLKKPCFHIGMLFVEKFAVCTGWEEWMASAGR